MARTTIIKSLISLMGLGILFSFQNCSKANFTSAVGANSGANMQSLTPMDTGDSGSSAANSSNSSSSSSSNSGLSNNNVANSGNNNGMGNNNGAGNNNGMGNNNGSGSHSGGSCANMGSGSHSQTQDQDDDRTGLVGCNLIENGKALKVGLMNSDSDGSTVKMVCMSAVACTTSIAKHFKVPVSVDSSVCNHATTVASNVQNLSDDDIDSLLHH